MNWLQRHKRSAWALVLAHVLLSIFTHAAVQDIARWIQDSLTSERLGSLVTASCSVALGAGSCAVILRLAKTPKRGPKAVLFGLTLIALVLSYTTLIMVNTEAIHFVQYAILSVIVFSIHPRCGECVLLVALLGAVDESYQYWVLSRNVAQYLDFNDMVLNLEGGALGVVGVSVFARSTAQGTVPYTLAAFARSTALRLAVGVLGTALFLGFLGEVALYPESGASIVLRTIGPPPEAFFQTSYWGKTVHVLLPWEGLTLIAALVGFYVFMDVRLALNPLPPVDDPAAA